MKKTLFLFDETFKNKDIYQDFIEMMQVNMKEGNDIYFPLKVKSTFYLKFNSEGDSFELTDMQGVTFDRKQMESVYNNLEIYDNLIVGVVFNKEVSTDITPEMLKGFVNLYALKEDGTVFDVSNNITISSKNLIVFGNR